MHRTFCIAALAAFVFFAVKAPAQSVTFDFQTAGPGGDQGWGSGFDGDQMGSGRTLPIVFENGSNYARVTRTGGFQETAYQTGNNADPFFIAMAAAAADPANSFLDYDWYVDTSTLGAGAGTFFQVGSYVNTGSGYYAQDFGAVKEVELNGTQLASGQVFSGHFHASFSSMGYAMPAAQTFFRLGIIENGNGAAQYADFDNITVSHVPEPASLGLLGIVTAFGLRRRRA